MVESYTGTIKTDGEFKTVESVIEGFTFTVGKIYTMQIQNSAYFKINNAIFFLDNEKLQYKAGTDDLYIKTQDGYTCTLTILESENE